VQRRKQRPKRPIPTYRDLSRLRDGNPRAQLHVWEAALRTQIRAFGRVEILTGDAVADIWARVPAPSHVSYGKDPAVGTTIGGPFEYDLLSEFGSFAVLRCHLTRIDLVDLAEPHRRAIYVAQDGWAGQWISP